MPEEEKGKRNIDIFYRRTKMCKFYLAGGCSRGESCLFAHGQLDLRVLPDFSKTRFCPEMQKSGQCQDGIYCKFAHSKQELRARCAARARQTAAEAMSPSSASPSGGSVVCSPYVVSGIAHQVQCIAKTGIPVPSFAACSQVCFSTMPQPHETVASASACKPFLFIQPVEIPPPPAHEPCLQQHIHLPTLLKPQLTSFEQSKSTVVDSVVCVGSPLDETCFSRQSTTDEGEEAFEFACNNVHEGLEEESNEESVDHFTFQVKNTFLQLVEPTSSKRRSKSAS